MAATLSVQMIKIPVSDIEKALPFYRDVLGLREDFVVAEYGWAQFTADELPLALYVPGMGGGSGSVGQSDSVHFAAADADAFTRQLAAAGLTPENHLHQGNDGSRYFELHDPDGNTFKVMLP